MKSFIKDEKYGIYDCFTGHCSYYFKVVKRTDKTVTFFDDILNKNVRKKIKILDGIEFCTLDDGDISADKTTRGL